jgi:hypothetical protein
MAIIDTTLAKAIYRDALGHYPNTEEEIKEALRLQYVAFVLYTFNAAADWMSLISDQGGTFLKDLVDGQ